MNSGPAHADPIGALAQWHQELAAGYRGQRGDRPSTWISDALYLAACYEALGLDARRAGLSKSSALYFARSAEIIVSAVKEASVAA